MSNLIKELGIPLRLDFSMIVPTVGVARVPPIDESATFDVLITEMKERFSNRS